jgi:hypothetical protein
VHVVEKADSNVYAYVGGRVLAGTDPVGFDYVARIRQGSMTIVVPLHVVGIDADKVANAAKKDFATHWKNRKVDVIGVGKVDVTFQLQVTTSKSASGTAPGFSNTYSTGNLDRADQALAQANADSHGGSEVRGLAITSRGRGGTLPADEATRRGVFSHEAGHLMGISDKPVQEYQEGKTKKEAAPRDIMGGELHPNLEVRDYHVGQIVAQTMRAARSRDVQISADKETSVQVSVEQYLADDKKLQEAAYAEAVTADQKGAQTKDEHENKK